MSNKQAYEINKDFREYVDRYSKTRHITVEEALTHLIVTIVRLQYMEE